MEEKSDYTNNPLDEKSNFCDKKMVCKEYFVKNMIKNDDNIDFNKDTLFPHNCFSKGNNVIF